MIKILLVSHGNLAKGLKSAVDTIFGQSENIEIESLLSGEDINLFGERILSKIEKISLDDKLIIFSDLILASPYTQSQIAISKSKNKENIVLFGNTNLPMLIEVINRQILNSNFEETIENIKKIGNQKVDCWTYQSYENETIDDDF